jgi:phosphomannomutase
MATPEARKRILLLFDVDGTLTVPRKKATDDMLQALSTCKAAGYTLGLVGGSDLKKQEEQVGNDVLERFDYVFSENGLLAFHHGKEIHRQSLVKWLGNERLMKLCKFTLHYIADLDIPVQRGTFFELRNGMVNISPIGRNCSQEERDEFERYDKEHHVREKMIAALTEKFPDYGLKYSIGGQISFDAFPIGWDKTYCLQFCPEAEFDQVHFFGDKTTEGGNDYEIYTHPRTIGHHVNTYNDTIAILKKDFHA